MGSNTPYDVYAILRRVNDGHGDGIFWDPKPSCPEGTQPRFIQVVKQDIFGTSNEWVDISANPTKKGLAGLFYGNSESADYPIPGIDTFKDAPSGQAYDAVFEVCRLCVSNSVCGEEISVTTIGPCVTWKRHHGAAGYRELDRPNSNDSVYGAPIHSSNPSQQWFRTVIWTLTH